MSNGIGASSFSSPFSSSTRTFQRVPSATSLLPPTSDAGLTADDLIAHQALLETQAREAIPFSFTRASCTHAKGYIRQPLWACRDCGGGAVCAGCSIGCHAEHELIELFAKRRFRCDCGCPSLQRRYNVEASAGEGKQRPDLKPCNLRASPLNFAPENDDNVYTKNFDGHFCYCEKGYTYDPMEEEETMFQCLVCEEWLHETCTSLRPRVSASTSKEAAATGTEAAGAAAADAAEKDAEPEGPPPLVSHESFDNVICDACIRKHPILQHYVGAPAWGACLQLPDDDGVVQAADVDKVVDVSAGGSGSGSGGSRFLVLGLPINEELGGPAERTGRSFAGVKRELSPIVEGDGDGDGDGEEEGEGSRGQPKEGEEQDAKRLKVEHGGEDDATSTPAQAPGSDVPPGDVARTAAELHTTSTAEPAKPGCKLPPVHPLVRHLLQRPRTPEPAGTQPNPNDPDGTQRVSYRLDVFLDEGQEEGDGGADGNTGPQTASSARGFRAHFCRCADCLSALEDAGLTFLLEEEETYSPPASEAGEAGPTTGNLNGSQSSLGRRNSHGSTGADDDDAASESSSASHHSTYDLGLDALNRLPRAQTLEALQGYGRLKDALFEHLRPFAQSGRTVDEESIRTFFEEQRKRDREGRE